MRTPKGHGKRQPARFISENMAGGMSGGQILAPNNRISLLLSACSVFCQDQLLFCDDCDRGYHMYCLNPPVAEPPEGNDNEANNNNNSYSSYHFLSPYCGAGLVLRAFHVLSHLIITAP